MLGMISIFFEFTKARFMAQDVIYPGEGIFGRNDAKAETSVLWPPHAKS